MSGCASDVYGVSQKQWQTMTPPQQKMAMRNYYQRQESIDRYQAKVDTINAENAPVNNLISGLVSRIPKPHARRHRHRYAYKNERVVRHKTERCTYNGRSIPCNQMPKTPSMSMPKMPSMPEMP